MPRVDINKYHSTGRLKPYTQETILVPEETDKATATKFNMPQN